MAEPTKIVKGGFRATLALIFSILSMVLSVLAYTSSGGEDDLRARLRDFQTAVEKVKTESAEQLEKLRNETARALEKMGQTIKNEEKAPRE